MRRDSFLAMQEQGAVSYHCVSRIVDRVYRLGNKEKAYFVKVMRLFEDFCGVEVLAYCVMSNHFHILVRVPKKPDEKEGEELDDAEFLRRLSLIYKADQVAIVEKTLKKCRRNQAWKMIRELKARYTYRMGDVSEFMKAVKQKFSMWYNKMNARTGTLWERRYSVTMVGPGWRSRVVAAYIDLNPLRAGLVSAPAHYKYCSYGEAVAKKGLARERLVALMECQEEHLRADRFSPEEALAEYRMLLADQGEAVDQEAPLQQGESKAKRHKKRKGFSKAEVKKILKNGGQLSVSQLLSCKSRYFTAGLAVGSQNFVDGVLSVLKKKGCCLEGRKTGSCKLGHANALELRTIRKLTKDVVV